MNEARERGINLARRAGFYAAKALARRAEHQSLMSWVVTVVATPCPAGEASAFQHVSFPAPAAHCARTQGNSHAALW